MVYCLSVNSLLSISGGILNNILINTGGGLRYIRYGIDVYSTKSHFRSATQDDTSNEYPYEDTSLEDDKIFYFTLDFDVPTIMMSQTAGWMMGFRKIYYEANFYTNYLDIISPEGNLYHNYISSESSFGSNDYHYVFLEIDDFQKNCVTDKVVSINKYYMANNILARINLTTGKNTIILDNGSDLMFKKREYFGPTKLEKFRIRLLDRHGSVIQLNKNDFSFTLEIQQIYSY